MLVLRLDTASVLTVCDHRNNRLCGYISQFGVFAICPSLRTLTRVIRMPDIGQPQVSTHENGSVIGSYLDSCFIDAEDPC